MLISLTMRCGIVRCILVQNHKTESLLKVELRRIKNKVIRKIRRCFIHVSEELIECLKSH